MIGLDLAKKVFHALGMDRSKKVVLKKALKRAKGLTFFCRLEPERIAMEACRGRTAGGGS